MIDNTPSCTIALAGNPNCGKTALFNHLTGLNQRVGNWAGVTVDKKMGAYVYHKKEQSVLDLPGTYALNARMSDGAEDQRIACQALLTESIDIIVNVVDATNLERHLYLTLQLLELGIPVVIALNMTDRLSAVGKQVDCDRLSRCLGCPVVPIVASQGKGMDALKAAIDQRRVDRSCASPVQYPDIIEQAITELSEDVQSALGDQKRLSRWVTLRYLEGDTSSLLDLSPASCKVVECYQQQIESILDEPADIMVADARYGYIEQCVKDAICIVKDRKTTVTERIDRVVLNRFLGLPIFFFVMYALFFFSINVAGAFQDFFDIAGSAIFVDGMAKVLAILQVPPAGIALLTEGVGVGINTTLTFIPVIGGMFLFLSFLSI